MRHFGLLALLLALAGPLGAEPAKPARAVLAGGCFWCIEQDLAKLPGVIDVVTGYAGGSRPAPRYDDYARVDAAHPVPHIEVVEVTYDASVLSHAALLGAFLRQIDPTDGGGQFCDRGPAYRPAIFVADAAERQAAMAQLAGAAQHLAMPTAVDVLETAPFWPAEAEHQDYAERNPLKNEFFRWNCGRDRRLREIWGAKTG